MKALGLTNERKARNSVQTLRSITQDNAG